MPYESGKNCGFTKSEVRCLEKLFGRLRDELGEYSMVIRTARGEEIQVPYLGRELEVERPVDKKIQSVEETSETIPKKDPFDWDTFAAGISGFVGTDWNPRPWSETGNIVDEIQGDVHGRGAEEQAHGGSVQLGAKTKRRQSNKAKDK
jgi:hypothetical protein